MAQQHRGPMGGGPRGAAGMMPGEKAKNFKGSMAKLIAYLGSFLPAIIAALVCALASCIFSIVGPKIRGNATTKLFEGVVAQLTGTGGIDFAAIGQILVFLACIYALSAALSGTRFDGWKLVEGRANRRYTDEAAVAQAVISSGHDPYERKLFGITAMERMLGKKQFSTLLDNLVERPQGKPTLVPASDKRPEMTNAKNDFAND